MSTFNKELLVISPIMTVYYVVFNFQAFVGSELVLVDVVLGIGWLIVFVSLFIIFAEYIADFFLSIFLINHACNQE